MALTRLSMLELAAKLRAREVSSVEATRACLGRIQASPLQAYLRVDEPGALAAARAADARLSGGTPASALDGVPVALKDIFCTRGLETTCGSKALQGFIPPYDATVVERLKAAGLPILGKTNQDEFAMGSSTESSAYFPTKNPWDLARTPGGSSGGSAAAVAAGEAFGALGTDTGGSIRQPAALTGTVGVKPTYGRVSRYGVIAFASSLDQVGPMTRTVPDAAALLQLIAGPDPRDATCSGTRCPDFSADLEKGVKGLRVGLPAEYFGEGTHPEVERSVRAAADALKKQGAELVDLSLPHSRYALATYYLVAPAEASSNLARYDGARYGPRANAASLVEMYRATRAAGFGPEVKRRIMLGTYALSAGYYDAYYLKAQKVRTLIRADFARAFERVDVLLSPTSPIPAFRLGEKLSDPLAMYLTDVLTLPVNLAGLPGLSLPSGFTADGLPIGAQLVGRPFDEPLLFRVARAFEREHDFHLRAPPCR